MIILGSTGSIGVQALQIIKSQNLNIEVLCAGDNIELLNTQIAEFRPKIVVIKDKAKRDLVRGAKKVLFGDKGIIEALNIAESSFVLNALVGFSGVRPSLEAIRLGKTLALANKESLVVAGFLIDSAELARIIPVDSEHFALKELLGNSVLGMQFRTCENFRTSTDSSLVESPKISTNTKATPQSLPLRFCESQNLGENSVKFAESTTFCHSERSEESQKKNNRDSSPTAQNDNFKDFAKSSLDSAPSTHEANSAIADEFLGFCEASDKDKTKVYRGSEPKRALRKQLAHTCKSLKSRCESKFAPHIKKMFITASGGAFRDFPLSQIPHQSAESALRHPTWAMGRKITIDSATMINKIFEILEARFLFGTQNIDAVIERSSTIHALIHLQNNALIAHFSTNDMRLPIASALLGAKSQNLAFIKELDLMDLNVRFERIDRVRYPLWALKDEVLKRPKIGAIINAANDILVERFLQHQICFGDISRGIFAVLDKFSAESIKNIDEILELNAKIKDFLSHFKGFKH